MQYITAVSKSSSEVDRVKRQLLESNPLLEGINASFFLLKRRKSPGEKVEKGEKIKSRCTAR